jgi:hypothetical protein
VITVASASIVGRQRIRKLMQPEVAFAEFPLDSARTAPRALAVGWSDGGGSKHRAYWAGRN